MALDLNCRECQAGLAQVGQMALGFQCFNHGTIGIEISELMKIATAQEREQCIKDVCEWCRQDRDFLPDTFAWHVPFVVGESSSGPIQCRAYSIHMRAARKQAEGNNITPL